MARPNWSRALPRRLVIPKVMTLRTLGDVRELMRHLPKEHRARHAWRHVEAEHRRFTERLARFGFALATTGH
ncbi:MAG: hypothetical protein ACLP0B_05785 [Steroidobacteraceae bacterium]